MLSRRTFWSAKLGIAARALEADGLDEATRGHRLRSWRRSTRTVNASRSRRLCLRTSRANRRCRLKLTTRRANATATATRRGVTTCPRGLCCCSEGGRFAGSASMQSILPESWRHDRTSVRDHPASRPGCASRGRSRCERYGSRRTPLATASSGSMRRSNSSADWERRSPKFEHAPRRWLVRYLTEGTPSLRDVAKVSEFAAKRNTWKTTWPCGTCSASRRRSSARHAELTAKLRIEERALEAGAPTQAFGQPSSCRAATLAAAADRPQRCLPCLRLEEVRLRLCLAADRASSWRSTARS